MIELGFSSDGRVLDVEAQLGHTQSRHSRTPPDMASRSAQRDDAQVGQSRGAQESLLENTGATKTTGTEATPLLGNGGDSPNGENANEGNEEYVWQRSTDFEGLGWWNTPSVRGLPVLIFSMLINAYRSRG